MSLINRLCKYVHSECASENLHNECVSLGIHMLTSRLLSSATKRLNDMDDERDRLAITASTDETTFNKHIEKLKKIVEIEGKKIKCDKCGKSGNFKLKEGVDGFYAILRSMNKSFGSIKILCLTGDCNKENFIFSDEFQELLSEYEDKVEKKDPKDEFDK